MALARTFAMPSPLLLMDEPFGALDAQTKLQLQDLLLHQQQLLARLLRLQPKATAWLAWPCPLPPS